LTVSDADLSAAWYRDLLGMEEISRYIELVSLVERHNDVELCLADHRSGPAAGPGWITLSSWYLTAMSVIPG
jgi:catechol 2,3-dioxygenase-like lactoylglutathione lyase family enzyme